MNLLNNRPVLVSATTEPNSTDGHMWIIDGVYNHETIVTDYYVYVHTLYDNLEDCENHPYWDFIEWFITLPQLQQFYPNAPRYYDGVEVQHSREQYFLMNWGYNGRYDEGYYSYGISDSWVSNDTYANNKSIYYNIQPSSLYIQP